MKECSLDSFKFIETISLTTIGIKHDGTAYRTTDLINWFRICPDHKIVGIAVKVIPLDTALVPPVQLYNPTVCFLFTENGDILLPHFRDCFEWSPIVHNLPTGTIVSELHVIKGCISITDTNGNIYQSTPSWYTLFKYLTSYWVNGPTGPLRLMFTSLTESGPIIAHQNSTMMNSTVLAKDFTDSANTDMVRLSCGANGTIQVQTDPNKAPIELLRVSSSSLYDICVPDYTGITDANPIRFFNRIIQDFIPLAFACGANGTIVYTTDPEYLVWKDFSKSDWLPKPAATDPTEIFVKISVNVLVTGTVIVRATNIQGILAYENSIDMIQSNDYRLSHHSSIYITSKLAGRDDKSMIPTGKITCGKAGLIRVMMYENHDCGTRTRSTEIHITDSDLYGITLTAPIKANDRDDIVVGPLAFVCGDNGIIMCTDDPEYLIWKPVEYANTGISTDTIYRPDSISFISNLSKSFVRIAALRMYSSVYVYVYNARNMVVTSFSVPIKIRIKIKTPNDKAFDAFKPSFSARKLRFPPENDFPPPPDEDAGIEYTKDIRKGTISLACGTSGMVRITALARTFAITASPIYIRKWVKICNATLYDIKFVVYPADTILSEDSPLAVACGNDTLMYTSDPKYKIWKNMSDRLDAYPSFKHVLDDRSNYRNLVLTNIPYYTPKGGIIRLNVYDDTDTLVVEYSFSYDNFVDKRAGMPVSDLPRLPDNFNFAPITQEVAQQDLEKSMMCNDVYLKHGLLVDNFAITLLKSRNKINKSIVIGDTVLGCGEGGLIHIAARDVDGNIITREFVKICDHSLYDIQLIEYPHVVQKWQELPLAIVCGNRGTVMYTADPEYKVWKDIFEDTDSIGHTNHSADYRSLCIETHTFHAVETQIPKIRIAIEMRRTDTPLDDDDDDDDGDVSEYATMFIKISDHLTYNDITISKECTLSCWPGGYIRIVRKLYPEDWVRVCDLDLVEIRFIQYPYPSLLIDPPLAFARCVDNSFIYTTDPMFRKWTPASTQISSMTKELKPNHTRVKYCHNNTWFLRQFNAPTSVLCLYTMDDKGIVSNANIRIRVKTPIYQEIEAEPVLVDVETNSSIMSEVENVITKYCMHPLINLIPMGYPKQVPTKCDKIDSSEKLELFVQELKAVVLKYASKCKFETEDQGKPDPIVYHKSATLGNYTLECGPKGFIRISRTMQNGSNGKIISRKIIKISSNDLYDIRFIRYFKSDDLAWGNRPRPLAIVCGDNGTIMYTNDPLYKSWRAVDPKFMPGTIADYRDFSVLRKNYFPNIFVYSYDTELVACLYGLDWCHNDDSAYNLPERHLIGGVDEV